LVERPPNAPVTFGSFNNPAKLSSATLDAWAELLTRLPAARLLLKGPSFADPRTRALFLERFLDRGIAGDRLTLVGHLPATEDHLALYRNIDIALDPFPYNGTTTSCEALWMGVPIVTLLGDRHSGRVGASILGRLGLDELIGQSVADYVEIAVRLAGDHDRRSALRRSLRQSLAASSLCDAPRFARNMEGAYRTMWKRWCGGVKALPDLGWATQDP
jgi:predicted O-linked N-acetylglucosamine transferase (SPINDLY family)